MQETWVQSLGQEDPLEKEMATYPNILTWKIPWTEEPGGLQSMVSQRVGDDVAIKQQQRDFSKLLFSVYWVTTTCQAWSWVLGTSTLRELWETGNKLENKEVTVITLDTKDGAVSKTKTKSLSLWAPVAAATAKSLQLCPTLHDPIPGILQAKKLEWVAISFSNA